MSDQFILESFWQKGHNCAFVAFTKVAMMKFGRQGFIRITETKEGFKVKLRNGRQMEFTASEVKELNKMNKIGYRRFRNKMEKRLISDIRTLVNISYAVVIRNMSTKGYEGKLFAPAEAMTALNDEGIKTVYFHSLLGVKRTVSKELNEKNIHQLKRARAILLFTERHIVAASKGLFDKYGKAISMGNSLPFLTKDKVAAYYTLK